MGEKMRGRVIQIWQIDFIYIYIYITVIWLHILKHFGIFCCHAKNSIYPEYLKKKLGFGGGGTHSFDYIQALCHLFSLH